MSTHAFTQFWNSLRKKPCTLFAKATFASGTADAVLSDSRGFVSIKYVSTGVYNIVLDTPYRTFLGSSAEWVDVSAIPLTDSFYFSAMAPQSKTATIVLTLNKVATAPASTSTLYLKMDFDDSSAT
jgi:hypothetical protein